MCILLPCRPAIPREINAPMIFNHPEKTTTVGNFCPKIPRTFPVGKRACPSLLDTAKPTAVKRSSIGNVRQIVLPQTLGGNPPQDAVNSSIVAKNRFQTENPKRELGNLGKQRSWILHSKPLHHLKPIRIDLWQIPSQRQRF